MKSFKQFLQESSTHYSSDSAFRNYWNSRGVNNGTIMNSVFIRPFDIKIDEDKQQGLGTEFMEDLCKFADSWNLQIRLSPSVGLGATSVNRLKKFYKRFGFKENKGKQFNPVISEKMFRPAKENQ